MSDERTRQIRGVARGEEGVGRPEGAETRVSRGRCADEQNPEQGEHEGSEAGRHVDPFAPY